MLKYFQKALVYGIPVLFLFSCATYNQQVNTYYRHMATGNYAKASESLDNNKLLSKSRNRLLYLLEKGKMAHLMQQWDSSNVYFNEADQIMEGTRFSAKDAALGTLLNPMMESYRGEDFEKYMVHYYKAMNYLQLNQPEEALVEARRISLRTYAQDDKVRNENKYTEDAFSFMLQGLIYEKNRDLNNAFIAFRNAADVYIGAGLRYYGTEMPEQLKKDLLRTAFQNGFIDELERYEKILDRKFDRNDIRQGELVIFWEAGRAPVKIEQNLFFNVRQYDNRYFFVDHTGLLRIPYSGSTSSGLDLLTLRAAVPRYIPQTPGAPPLLVVNGSSVIFEPAQNINEIAIATLNERMVKELAKTLSRLAVKKLAEAATKADVDEDDDEKEKKNKRSKQAINAGLKIFNYASEKADTRNWQSLPHTIYYTRVSLAPGENLISAPSSGQMIRIINTGSLAFSAFCGSRN